MARILMCSMLFVLIVLSSPLWAAAAGPDCSSAIPSLADCQGYVTGTAPAPPNDCCSALANVFHTEPICLCELFLPGGPATILPGFNPGLAKALPGLCHVEGANPSLCNALMNATTPTGAPNTSTPSGSGASACVSTVFICLLAAAVAALFA